LAFVTWTRDLNVSLIDSSYPRRRLIILGCHRVALQTIVNSGHEWVRGTAESSEIVHVDGPDHSAQIFLLLDEAYLVNDTVNVLVANPLGACELRIISNP